MSKIIEQNIDTLNPSQVVVLYRELVKSGSFERKETDINAKIIDKWGFETLHMVKCVAWNEPYEFMNLDED